MKEEGKQKTAEFSIADGTRRCHTVALSPQTRPVVWSLVGAGTSKQGKAHVRDGSGERNPVLPHSMQILYHETVKVILVWRHTGVNSKKVVECGYLEAVQMLWQTHTQHH